MMKEYRFELPATVCCSVRAANKREALILLRAAVERAAEGEGEEVSGPGDGAVVYVDPDAAKTAELLDVWEVKAG